MSAIEVYASKPVVIEVIEWRPEHKDEIKQWIDFDKVQFDWVGSTPRIQVYNTKAGKWMISDHRAWYVVKDSEGHFSLVEEEDLNKQYDLT